MLVTMEGIGKEKIPEPVPENYLSLEGRKYQAQPAEEKVLVNNGDPNRTKSMELTPNEWERFKTKKRVIPQIRPEKISDLKSGDIVEVKDGTFLKIIDNNPETRE